MNTQLRSAWGWLTPLRCSFRLMSFGYVLNDALRLTQALSAVVATKAGPDMSCPTDSSATGKCITKLTNLLYNCKECLTNQPIFMQNKANFCKVKIIVSSLI